jgi:hypothetical protein
MVTNLKIFIAAELGFSFILVEKQTSARLRLARRFTKLFFFILKNRMARHARLITTAIPCIAKKAFVQAWVNNSAYGTNAIRLFARSCFKSYNPHFEVE